MDSKKETDEGISGVEEFSKLLSDLLSGDATELICIVPRKSGEVGRIRFFTDDQGILRRSLL